MAKEKEKDCTIKVKEHVYKKLQKFQGFLEMTEGKRYSMSQIINSALEFVPEIEFEAKVLPKEEKKEG